MEIQRDMQRAPGFFTLLVRSWKELTVLLQPSELATMGLIIAHKALLIYRAMVHFWLLVGVCMVLMTYEQSYHAVTVILLTLYGLFILLLARSSVPLKSYQYIFASSKTIVAFFLLVGIVGLNLIPWHAPFWASVLFGWHSVMVILSPLIRLIVLCSFDAYPELVAQKNAFMRAGTIFLYHYPFFIMVYLIAWYLIYPIIAWPVLLFVGHMQQVAEFIALLLWIPWYSAAIVYGYTRFMREHMDYYY